MSHIPYKGGERAAIPDTPDNRDFIVDEILGAPVLPAEYDVIQEVGGVKVESQGASLSCIGQSVSKYAEVLDRLENPSKADLSAKFIYSRIFQPQGGASIRDAFKLWQKLGDCEEVLDPSYSQLNALGEAEMRIVNNDPSVLANALIYRIETYATLWHNYNTELIKQTIYQNHGAICGFYGTNVDWSKRDGLPTGVVTPPSPNENPNNYWAHGVFLCGWSIIQGREYIKFINSWGKNWGDNGYGYIHPDYWNGYDAFSLWTAVDMPNEIFKLMVDKELLELLYQGIFKRLPDAGADGYLGKPVKEVVRLLLESPENKQYSSVYQAVKNVENDIRAGKF